MGDSNFKNALAQVKSAYNLPDYIQAAGVNLKPSGASTFKGNCPFHTERTPSFSVNSHFQNYRCFGCGANGDLLSFVMNHEHLSFYDALTKLAEDKNIPLDLGKSDDSGVDYKSLQKIVKTAANFYCIHFNKLGEDHLAKTEILDRGLTFDNSSPDTLKYGYSPSGNALYKYLKKQGFTDDLILESGVCRKNEKTGDIFDFFRSRLMFILTDRYNKPVGFSSRKLYEDDTRGKYVNSSDSPVFKKSSVLYNHFLSRKKAGVEKKVFIVEGQFDVAAFMEAGITNVVAASGTAFTRDHVNECKKLVGNTGKLVFCFDGDAAGLKAAASVFMNFPDIHEDAYVILFPDGADPCDYRQEHGNEALADYVSKPVTIVEFMIRKTKENHDLSSVVGRANYVEEAASIVKTVTNLTLRENCLRLLSLESFTPVNTVRAAVDAAEPMKFTNAREEVQEEHLAVPEFEEDSNSDGNTLSVDELQELSSKDKRYEISSRFINLGLTRPMWRASVVRSKYLIPEEFYGFIDELENFSNDEVLFPEKFTDVAVAKYLFDGQFSPFYRFMELEELKELFIGLHKKLEGLKSQEKKDAVQARIYELLASDSSGSLEYFKAILDSEGKVLASSD